MATRKAIDLVRRLSVGIREPSLVPIGETEPKFANPYLHVNGIGPFYLFGDIPLAKAREIRAELQADLAVAQDRIAGKPGTAWLVVERGSELKGCPRCGESALEGEQSCFYCGEEPEDDTSWRVAGRVPWDRVLVEKARRDRDRRARDGEEGRG